MKWSDFLPHKTTCKLTYFSAIKLKFINLEKWLARYTCSLSPHLPLTLPSPSPHIPFTFPHFLFIFLVSSIYYPFIFPHFVLTFPSFSPYLPLTIPSPSLIFPSLSLYLPLIFPSPSLTFPSPCKHWEHLHVNTTNANHKKKWIVFNW